METVPNFWVWYYSQALKNLFNIYYSIILLTFDYFSIGFLLKTLFAPWKKDVVAPETPSLQLLIQAFWLNLVARLIGLLVRLTVVVIGSIAVALVTVLGAGILLAGTLLPISVILVFWAGLSQLTSGGLPKTILGAVLIASDIIAIYYSYKSWLLDRFRDSEPTQPLAKIDPLQTNPVLWLTKKSAQLIKKSKNLVDLKKNLADTNEIRFILSRLSINTNDFLSPQSPNELTLKDMIVCAARVAVKLEKNRISFGHILAAFFALDKNLNDLLIANNLNLDDLDSVIGWQTRIWQEIEAPSDLITPGKIRFSGGIGKNWASGYTNYLDRFSSDITEQVQGSHYERQFIAHKPQIDEIERILARSGKHNVVLVGETGVGRRTTIYGFTARVVSGKTLLPLRYKRIVELNVSAILANTQTPGELEGRLVGLLNEAVHAGNVILFVDDFQRLLSGGNDSVGVVNAGEIMIPYLQSPRFQLLATITPALFHNTIERQPSVAAVFEKIEIIEPDDIATLRILQDISPVMESRHGVNVTYQALREIVKQAKRYLPEKKFPEKGIDLLDEVAVDVSSHKQSKLITEEVVDNIISQKTNIPVGETNKQEKTVLLDLENQLHKRIVNQENAIVQVANSLRRSRAGVGSPSKPVGTFLFLGPTGVGKTETAKALAEIYFGSEKALIRLDMSEYQEISSIRRLIGDETQGIGGALTNAIREKPFTCVLLDEIEKAHPKILDIFLQVLDEGRLTDALGQAADFRNSIIISTSNAGANFIRQTVVATNGKPDMAILTKELLNKVQNDNIFRPEFLNRFDGVVAFRPLDINELGKVVDLQLVALNKRLLERQITVVLTPGAKIKLAKLGFDPEFGARALVRTMVNSVENLVAQAILGEKLKKGMTFEIGEEMI